MVHGFVSDIRDKEWSLCGQCKASLSKKDRKCGSTEAASDP